MRAGGRSVVSVARTDFPKNGRRFRESASSSLLTIENVITEPAARSPGRYGLIPSLVTRLQQIIVFARRLCITVTTGVYLSALQHVRSSYLPVAQQNAKFGVRAGVLPNRGKFLASAGAPASTLLIYFVFGIFCYRKGVRLVKIKLEWT